MDKIQVANLDFNLEVPDSNLEVFLPSFLSNFDQILIKVDIRNINLEVQVRNLDFVHIVDLISGTIEFFLPYHMDLCWIILQFIVEDWIVPSKPERNPGETANALYYWDPLEGKWGESNHEEVKSWEWNQVNCQISQVDTIFGSYYKKF